MNVCAVLAGLLLGCVGPSPPPVPPATPALPALPTLPAPQERVDRWLAEDKLRHFTTSFAATAMAYAGARTAVDMDLARALAAGTALSLGLGKEVVDARSGRWFSFKDLVWDAAGVAVGVVLVNRIR